jgi:hypothetical protein
MKKYALLMLIVLGTSTVAVAGPWACVDVPKCVCSGDNVTIKVGACLQGTFSSCMKVVPCVQGNLILVDIYLTRTDKCLGSLQLCKPVDLKTLCPGLYSVVARIYVKDVGDCPPLGGVCALAAVGSAYFNVKCCDPCCSPFPWWF